MNADDYPECATCGTILPPGKDVGRRRVYCSDDCRKHPDRVRKRERGKARLHAKRVADDRFFRAFDHR